jgi:hypothetical protein
MQASQMKNFILGGAQNFQFGLHDSEVMAPWKSVS